MVKRLDGARKRSRHKMKKAFGSRGKISLTNYFQEFKKGDSAVLKAEPAYQNGIYPLKFHGRICVVEARRGKCYEVMIKDGGKKKTLLVHPVHLIKVQNDKS